MFGKNKPPKISIEEFALKLSNLANDPASLSGFFEQYPSLSYDDKMKRHAAALQWYAAHLYNITVNYKNLSHASFVRQAMESGATLGVKMLHNDYMRDFDPLLEKPGRTAINESFVEDVGNRFREVCSREISAPEYNLTAFGKLVYKNTFNKCLESLGGYEIR